MTNEAGPRWRWTGIVFIPMFLFGFPLLSGLFTTYVSPGLAFVLTAAIAMGLVFAWNALFGRREEPALRNGGEIKVHPALKALGLLWVLAGAGSWGTLAYIETNALSQPNHAQGAFTVAMHLKGVVRYMTPEQHTIDQIAKWTFIGCVLAGLVVGISISAWERFRDSDR